MPPRRYTVDQWTAAFWQRIRVGTVCWIWTGATNGNGYGVFTVHSRRSYAHRMAYELLVGPIPEGTEIDHLCRNRACCNPAHLEAVTHQVNMLRGDTIAARHAAKTECAHGHPFDAANTYERPGGGRGCRTCNADLAERLAILQHEMAIDLDVTSCDLPLYAEEALADELRSAHDRPRIDKEKAA